MFKKKRKKYKEAVIAKTCNGEYILKASKGLEDELIKAWEENVTVWAETIDGARVLIHCKGIKEIKRIKDYKPRRNIATDIELDGLTFILVTFTLCATTACILSLIWRL